MTVQRCFGFEPSAASIAEVFHMYHVDFDEMDNLLLRLFFSDAFFYVRIRTECSEHENSCIDAY